MKTNNYNLLIAKLDRFIRKYYVNQLLKGALYSVGLITLCVLIFSLAEYFFYFPKGVRKVLFFSFIGIVGFAAWNWLLTPVIHYFKLGKVISHEQAATIIGNHFSEVKDKLLNILQLRKQSDSNDLLVLASIDQKTKDIATVPFQSAIDLRKNRRYLPYALPPLLILLAVLFSAPSIITDSSRRILKNNLDFEKEAPFKFIVQNDLLEVPQFEDFQLNVKIEGDYLPHQAFININGFEYRLQKTANDEFSYRFNNVQEKVSFYLESDEVRTSEMELTVLEKPNVLNINTLLDYPGYTLRKDENQSNVGDIIVPEGTRILWNIDAINTSTLEYAFGNDQTVNAEATSENSFAFQKRFYRNQDYHIIVGNELLPRADSISYSIQVIEDQYPAISVQQFEDSTEDLVKYFVGEISDDYGLSRLSFNYQLFDENDQVKSEGIDELSFEPGQRSQYNYIFDINQMELAAGDKLIYYFEVFDNDAVNGTKSSKSSILQLHKPSKEEYERLEEDNEEDIKSALSKAKSESDELQKDFEKYREKLLQEKNVDWQMKKELQQLLERQSDMNQQMKNAKEKYDENLKNQEEFSQPSEQLEEKQNNVEQLFEEMMNDETKELMEKIQELLEELNKEDALKIVEEMQMNEQDFNMQLERLEELYKQLEMERDIMQQLDKLQELAEKQEDLAKETEDMVEEEATQDQEMEKQAEMNSDDSEMNNDPESKENNEAAEEQKNQQGEENKTEESEKQDNSSQNENEKQNENQNSEELQPENDREEGDPKTQEELVKEQEDINDAFEDIKEELENLEERNEEMNNPKDFNVQEQQSEEIQEQLDQSLQQMQQNQNSKASESQKNAAQKMKQMAAQMEQQMQQSDQQQMQEDMKSLRQLMENLLTMSFDQEKLIDDLSRTRKNTPQYGEQVQTQYKLNDDFRLIEDSLQALSQRVYQIESFVLDKVGVINHQMDLSLDLLEDRKKDEAGDHQHRVMKNVNDLALMFSETMQQMQQQMAAQMSGQQMCTNPGQSNPSQGQGQMPLDKITEGQRELGDEMKDKQQQMKDKGGEKMSKEFAQMAARQAALRKALEDLQKKKQELGNGSKELQNILDEMDKIETDLVNKRLTNEMMRRQKEILTRLLESERAEREQEKDNTRKSETAKETKRELPSSLDEYLKKREAQIEPFKQVSPALKPYYKQLVEEYYKSLKVD